MKYAPFCTLPSSSGKKKYTISLDETNTLSCDCPSWIFKSSGKRTCKHVDFISNIITVTFDTILRCYNFDVRGLAQYAVSEEKLITFFGSANTILSTFSDPSGISLQEYLTTIYLKNKQKSSLARSQLRIGRADVTYPPVTVVTYPPLTTVGIDTKYQLWTEEVKNDAMKAVDNFFGINNEQEDVVNISNKRRKIIRE